MLVDRGAVLCAVGGQTPAARAELMIRDDLPARISRAVCDRWNGQILAALKGKSCAAVTVVELMYATSELRVWNAGNPALSARQSACRILTTLQTLMHPRPHHYSITAKAVS